MSMLDISSICLLLLLICRIAESHIGQPCNAILRVCLPISSHIFCDDKNICRCRKEYPIVVGAHTCLAPKRVQERCSHPEECLFYDQNAFCNQSPYSSRCDCKSGFAFDNSRRLCVPETNNSRKSSNTTLMIPTAAGFLMACFSLLCCCALIWHNLCRKQELIARNGQALAGDRGRNRRNQRTSRDPNGRSDRRALRIETNLVDSGGQATNHLPPYDSILIDSMNNDPPPTYEEAIKDTQLPRVMASSSDAETNSEIKIT